MKRNRLISLSLFLLFGVSKGAYAFYCTSLGQTINGGTTDVYVNLNPSVQVGQNLIVRLGDSIQCKNQDPPQYLDPIRIIQGQYTGPLDSLAGSIRYYDSPYNFPIGTPTKTVNHTWGYPRPWNTILYLKVIGSGASGIAVNSGQRLATLTMEKVNSIPYQTFTWNIYVKNTVVVPTSSCDVSSRNVTVTLPDYPGRASVPLTVHCAQNQRLAYYLTGTTADTARTIFTNTSSSNPATGVGVQLSNYNGVIATYKKVSLGTVGTSPISLRLKASYARTTGQVVAGNVQSIIGVTFVYE